MSLTACLPLCRMEAAMIAGAISAVATFVVQNMTFVNPIRGSMPATTLRSSHLNRSNAARTILDDPVQGRSRVLVRVWPWPKSVELPRLLIASKGCTTTRTLVLCQYGAVDEASGGLARGQARNRPAPYHSDSRLQSCRG